MELRCHRWTVENRPPAADPVIYDWSDRVEEEAFKFSRNGWDQPIQGKAQGRLMLTDDDLADLEWGSLLLHFWIVVIDQASNDTATFDFGSWVVSEQSECVDLEAPAELGRRTMFDVRLYDRIGWLDIPNAIAWDVTLTQGWDLASEIRRIIEHPASPWGIVGGGAPFGGKRHQFAARVLSDTRQDAADNTLRWSAGETTWLDIINSLSMLAVERGTLAYCTQDGTVTVPSWRTQTGGIGVPSWRFDTTQPDDVISGAPRVKKRKAWNQPNQWVAIGTADLEGAETSARGNAVTNVHGEFGTVSTGRTITEVLRMESRDLVKLGNLARFAAYCAGQDASQVSLEVQPLPFLWQNEFVTIVSPQTFGDMSPREMVASEWSITFDGKTQPLTLRQVPRISDYSLS